MKSRIKSVFKKIDLHKFKQVKRFIIKSTIVGIFVLTIVFFKKINLRFTNSFLDLTKRWTEYEFNIYRDGERIFGKMQRTLENSVEVFNEYNPIKREEDLTTIDGEIVYPFEEGKSKGIDIRLNKDIDWEPISINNGIVTEIEEREKKGYFIKIVSGDKEFIYGYLLNTDLSKGDKVSVGDKIGHLGANKDGFKYLRMEIWEDDTPANPSEYINIK